MSPEQYLDWRFQFAEVWGKQPQIIALLEPQDQWQLHDYFQFHRHKSPPEALAWYFTVEACNPTVELDGLTAFAKLQAVLRHIDEMEDQMKLPLYDQDAESQRIRIYPLVRPEPEIDAIVSALIDMGYDMAKDKRNNDRPAA